MNVNLKDAWKWAKLLKALALVAYEANNRLEREGSPDDPESPNECTPAEYAEAAAWVLDNLDDLPEFPDEARPYVPEAIAVLNAWAVSRGETIDP